jgi:restriction endonuclease
MVGAALLLPNQAFAEKNELPAQKEQKASVQEVIKESVNEKKVVISGKNTEILKKTVNIPNADHFSKAEPSLKANTGQAISSHKTGAKIKTLSEKTNNIVQSVAKVKDKIGKATGLEKGGPKSSKEVLTIDKKTADKVKLNKNEQQSIPHNANTLAVGAGEIKESTKTFIAEKNTYSKKVVMKTPKKENRVPTKPKENPASKVALNPSPQTNPSAGKSKDRLNHSGLSSTSTVDKWMEWNNIYETNLILPYVSWIAMMSNQWMNAPPSPPPQESSLLIRINRH